MRFPDDVPTLTDGVVVLRAHRLEDAPGVLDQCLDPASVRWTTVPEGYTAEDARAFVTARVPAGWRDDSDWAFAVEALDPTGPEARFAGTVSLRPEGAGRAEIAYGAHPWARGRGVMERALRLLLAWGFEHQRLHTVIWWAHSDNWASRRLAWKVGFDCVGPVRTWLPQRGALLDGWVGTLRAEDARAPRSPWLDVPVLHGEHVVLRRPRADDVDRVVEGCRDPETAHWLGQIPQPFTRQHAIEFLDSKEAEHAAATALTWAIADPDDDRLIGLVNLFDLTLGRQAEVGYWVHPGARGRGVATGATRLAIRHGFVEVEDGGLGLVRVHARAAEENLASRRVLEAAGMTLTGRERRRLTLGGGALADAATYDVLRP